MLSCLGIHQLAQGALLLMGDIGPLWWDNEAFLTTCCSKHSSLWMCQQIHNDILDTIAPFILSFSPDVMQPGCEYWLRILVGAAVTPFPWRNLSLDCSGSYYMIFLIIRYPQVLQRNPGVQLKKIVTLPLKCYFSFRCFKHRSPEMLLLPLRLPERTI